MSSYIRPHVDEPVFVDASGAVIDYGHRWNGMPPEDTYSVESNLERFAPLHAVADALIDHLRDTYDVDMDEGPEVAADLMHGPVEALRAVRVRPRDPACAALSFVFSAYPGVTMHAGLLHDFHFPDCGCDACDCTWDGEAGNLEKQVFAVVEGRYREVIEGGLRPWVAHTFTYPDGMWTSGRSRDASPERRRAAKSVLRGVADGWAAWPLRPDGD